jgi:hypothetical protein
MIYPSLVPDYIQIRVPEYTGYKSEFKTSDYFRYPTQFYKVGYSFEFRYTNLCRNDLEIIRDFFYNLQLETNRTFVIPSIVFKNFPLNLKQRIFCGQAHWIIKEPELKITPKIINFDNQTYELNLTVLSVVA